MLMGIVGFLVSMLVVWPLDMTWGFTLTMLSVIFFIASMYNFTHAPEGPHLDIHNSESLKRKSRVGR